MIVNTLQYVGGQMLVNTDNSDCEEAMGYLTSTRCGSAVPPGRAADRSIECSVMDGWIFSGRSLGSIIVDEADQELERAESNSDDAVHAAIDCR